MSRGWGSCAMPLSAPAAQNRSNTLRSAAMFSLFTCASSTFTGVWIDSVPFGGWYLSTARTCRPTSTSVTSSANWLYLTTLPCCALREPSLDSSHTAAAFRSRWSNAPDCPRIVTSSCSLTSPVCATSKHLKHARARSIASLLSVAPKTGRWVPRVTSGVDRPVDAKSSTSDSNTSSLNASFGSSTCPTLAP